MSEAKARLWATQIHDGKKTVQEVIDKFGDEGYTAVDHAYFIKYGVHLNEID